jgi:hypothetical protein
VRRTYAAYFRDATPDTVQRFGLKKRVILWLKTLLLFGNEVFNCQKLQYAMLKLEEKVIALPGLICRKLVSEQCQFRFQSIMLSSPCVQLTGIIPIGATIRPYQLPLNRFCRR